MTDKPNWVSEWMLTVKWDRTIELLAGEIMALDVERARKLAMELNAACDYIELIGERD